MTIDSININNFKSIRKLGIEKPGNFLVFVGANASGKSNIFEALEFANSVYKLGNEAISLFGGNDEIRNFNLPMPFYFKFGNYDDFIDIEEKVDDHKRSTLLPLRNTSSYNQFTENFSRIFYGKSQYVKININDDSKLRLDCKNLEKVLGRLLSEREKKEEIIEILQTLIPEFNDIEIVKSEYSKEDRINVYEKNASKPFSGNLISDGTYNILSLITAVLQNDEPQFLCIEEPENGLNPKVVKELVIFFREQCELNGHYIWLSTHSQSLVNVLSPKEIIIVDKKEGQTKIKQIDGLDLHGLKVDEAWLSNVFGGGIPW
ncbi:MAG: AAA family ATPase [Ignavibacteriaceae bacterium]